MEAQLDFECRIHSWRPVAGVGAGARTFSRNGGMTLSHSCAATPVSDCRDRMRIALISAVLFLFMALGVVGLALRQPPVRFDEAVLVRVSPDHYEIAGKRFEGSLADQLDRYAKTTRKVSILIIGPDTVVRTRAQELDHLRANSNIRIATFTSRAAP